MLADAAASAQRRWYVVHTLPAREMEVARRLTVQEFRAFVPTHWKTVRHARQFRTLKAPFFPRYLFVEMAIGRVRWRSINGTIGVARLIMEGDRPKPVPPGIVEALLALCDRDGLLRFDGTLQPGEAVRVMRGPFAGTLGTLVRQTSTERVEVLLEIMGSHVALTTSAASLAPVA